MQEEKRIWWNSVNGPRSGVIVGKTKFGYKVRRNNGKFLIVHPNSIIHAETTKQESR